VTANISDVARRAHVVCCHRVAGAERQLSSCRPTVSASRRRSATWATWQTPCEGFDHGDERNRRRSPARRLRPVFRRDRARHPGSRRRGWQTPRAVQLSARSVARDRLHQDAARPEGRRGNPESGYIEDDEFVVALQEQARGLRAQGSRLVLCGGYRFARPPWLPTTLEVPSG